MKPMDLIRDQSTSQDRGIVVATAREDVSPDVDAFAGPAHRDPDISRATRSNCCWRLR
jgi:hypothetical protein